MHNRKKEGKWVGHIDLNCRVKHVTEVKIKGRTRRGRIRKHLLNNFKEIRRRTSKDTTLDDSSGGLTWEKATEVL